MEGLGRPVEGELNAFKVPKEDLAAQGQLLALLHIDVRTSKQNIHDHKLQRVRYDSGRYRLRRQKTLRSFLFWMTVSRRSSEIGRAHV